MIAIEGFTEAQNAALEGVVAGNLILIQKSLSNAANDSEHDGDSEAEESEDDEGRDSDSSSEHEEDGDANVEDGAVRQTSQNETDETDAPMEGSSASPGTLTQHGQAPTDEAENNSGLADATALTPTMFVVVGIVKDDTNGNVTGVNLVPLQYNHKVGTAKDDLTYQVYGTQCVHSHQCKGLCADVQSIADIAEGEHFSLMVNPDGDYVRRLIKSPARCIEDCNDGFLNDVGCLSNMIKNYVPEMLAYEQNVGPVAESMQKPLCPVCMGLDLLRDQQFLQHDVMTATVDFTELLDFYAKLSRRRNVLQAFGGYRYIQFDERKWGHRFNDMLSEADDGADDDVSEYEEWDEADDPNANVQLRPASEEVLAALPRKQYSDVTSAEDHEPCCIDREGFQADSTLVELPCGHVNFHEDCILTWLRQFNNCPICRKVLLDANATDEVKEQDHRAAMRRMKLGEALTSLGFEPSTNIREVDGSMLEIIFSTARADRAGWRTETAIARLQAELARPVDAIAESDGQIDEDESYADVAEDAIMSDE